MYKKQIIEFMVSDDDSSSIQINLIKNNLFNNRVYNTELSETDFNKLEEQIKERIPKYKKNQYKYNIHNNLEEIIYNDNKFYYDKKLIGICLMKTNNTKYNLVIKNVDKRPIDPVTFPSINKYNNTFIRNSRTYIYNETKDKINGININFNTDSSKNNDLYHITIDFKCCKKNREKMYNNIMKLVNILFN